MRLPRDLSGRDLVAVLVRRWGYRQIHQSGSHIIIESETPVHHRLAVPDHRSLRVGTLNAILRAAAAAKAVTREEILNSL